MPNLVKNVVAGKPLSTGGVCIGPLGTALPADATTALDEALVSAGYIGEDGVTEAADRSTDKIRAWGGDTVKIVQTEFSTTYTFTFIETLNSTVLETVYGDDNVTTTAPTSSKGTLHVVKVNADILPHKVFVFEVKDGDAKIRIVVADGQVTEVGEITYSDSEVIGYEVTVEAFRDPTLNANAVKYMDDGVLAA
ncbi:MAG: hypothetical protein J2O47_02960 [Acidimicrobiaceae bacterium]|nr:hypothetical protein [Acidimicrobiaceae bacterium]